MQEWEQDRTNLLTRQSLMVVVVAGLVVVGVGRAFAVVEGVAVDAQEN